MIDLHVHTARCGHAEGSPREYVRAAAERGISVLCFTDHMPLAPVVAERIPGAEGYAMALPELDAYVADVRDAVVEGRAHGVEVLLGIEADLVGSAFEHARDLVAAYPFDMVLGSVHFIDDWAFDDPAHVDRYAEWDVRDLWERYFEDLIAAARSGIADVMSHADLVKKFCGAPAGPVDGLYGDAAHALAAAGVAVEVNTAGLRKPCHEMYPGPTFLRALCEAGVPVTVGSDAHSPVDVGRDADLAVTALKAAGYRSSLVFRKRVPEEVPLGDD